MAAVGSSTESLTKTLELAKFRLMQQMGMERKTKKELEQKIFAMESKVFERRQKLGEYNALFMSLDGAAERAPRQRLGAREAVSGTRRIIDINLHKLQSEISTQSLKLNRARASNLHLREKVDLLRKEHLTFRKLFSHMGSELDEIKEKIKVVRKSVKEGYDARDQAKEDQALLVKQFEEDKFERTKEWTLYTQAIEEADKEGHPSSVNLGVQGMTKEQEADIRKKIRAGMLVMAKEKGVLQVAKAKVSAYNEALAFVRSQTGYEDLQEVIDLFNRYEQEKYEKLGAISRLLVEIERNEVELQGSRNDVQTAEVSTSALKQQRARQLGLLEEQARQCEDKASETLASANRVGSEVKTLLVVVEMLFYTLAAGAGLTVPRQLALSSPSLSATSSSSASSSSASSSLVKSRPTASLKMYSSPALFMAVQEGSSITMSSLTSFMGMLENRASDLIQRYAAKVTMGEVADDGEVVEAEVAEEARELAEERALRANAEAVAAAMAEGGDAKVAELMASMDKAEAVAETAAATKRFFSPAALGPSMPTGRLKESLTTSALVAAMAISAGIGGGDEGGAAGAGAAAGSRRGGVAAAATAGGSGSGRGSSSSGLSPRSRGVAEEGEEEEEEGSRGGAALRPMSLEEIKRQTQSSISSDRTVKAIGSAAAVAAVVLGRAGGH